jgi:thymidylate synthase
LGGLKHIQQDTLDDLLRQVFGRLLRSRNRPSPTKGANREEIGALLTLRKPRARVSRTEQRATLFTCLGETLWYLSGSDRLDAIEYYIPNYRRFSDLPPEALTAQGAYGPRLFGTGGGINQVQRIIETLSRADKHDTRQAVIQIFDKSDVGNLDVPCTCTLQFFARGRLLHCHAAMRSNDAYLGLPHDIFAFTFLQELIARSMGHELGEYHHAVGSLHLYDAKEGQARSYIEEGWQSSTEVMPPMPLGDPWPALRWLLEQERAIRGGRLSIESATDVDPYWVDLARLLLIKAYFDRKDLRGIVRQSQALISTSYINFIRSKQRALRGADDELPLLTAKKAGTAS